MLTSLALTLGAPTVSYNNFFGNNNQVIVNGVSTPLAAAPPPPPAPEFLPSCNAVAPLIALDRFPPEDLPVWGNPFQLGISGYRESIVRADLIKQDIKDQVYNYPPYGISCLGFRGMINNLAQDVSQTGQYPDNTLFALPKPSDVDVANGKTYMDYYLPWKSATASIQDPHVKKVRELFAKVIDGFMIILAFEQWVEDSDFGSRYAGEMILVEDDPTIRSVDAAPAGTAAPEIDSDLFPLLPKIQQHIKALVDEYATDPTGMSPYFTDDPTKNNIPGINYVHLSANIEAHAFSALTAGKVTGFTQAAIDAYPTYFSSDFRDDFAATDGDADSQYLVAPNYRLNGPDNSFPNFPEGFEICQTARNFYTTVALKNFGPNGNSFACAAGAAAIEAMSKLFVYEKAVTASDAMPATCNKSTKEVADWFFSMIYSIASAQTLAYGIFGNPILTPEAVRVASTFVLDVMHIHLLNLNSAPACVAAGKTYYGHPIKFQDGMRMKSTYYYEAEFRSPEDKYFSEDLQRFAVVSRDEAYENYLEMKTLCPDYDKGRCPYTPEVRLPQPVCDDVGNSLIANAAAAEILRSSSDSTLYFLFASGCATTAAIIGPFDDSYGGKPGQVAGCGFENHLSAPLNKASNWNSTFDEICGSTCGVNNCAAPPAPDLTQLAPIFSLPTTDADKMCMVFTASMFEHVNAENKAPLIQNWCARSAEAIGSLVGSLVPSFQPASAAFGNFDFAAATASIIVAGSNATSTVCPFACV